MTARNNIPGVGLSVGEVVALYESPEDPGAGWVKHHVELTEEDTAPYLYMHSGSGPMNPSHAAWIRDVESRGAEVVWASRWGQLANRKFAPLIGLDPLPCGTDRYPPRMSESGQGWVYRALSRGYNGRPVVWVARDASAFDTGTRGLRVTVSTRSGVGLGPAEIEQMETFVSRWI